MLRRGFSPSLGTTFTLAIVAAVVTVLAAGLGIRAVIDIRSLRREVLEEATLLARVVGNYSVAELALGDRDEATEGLAKLRDNPDVGRAALYDKDGRLFAEYRNPELATALEVPSHVAGPIEIGTKRIGDGMVEVLEPVVWQGENRGAVLLRVSTDRLDERVRSYGWTALAVGAALVLASVGIAFLLQRRVSAPILALARIAERVSRSQDYSLRTDVHGAREIESLSGGLDGMLEALEQRERQRSIAETGRERFAERLRVLRGIDEAILAGQPVEAIAAQAIESLIGLVGASAASVAGIDDADGRARTTWLLAPHAGTPGNPSVELAEHADLARTLRGGGSWRARDAASIRGAGELLERLKLGESRAVALLPLIAEHELVGLVGIGQAGPDDFDDDDLEIAHEIARLLSVSLQQARLAWQIERHTQELENRVVRRTAALELSNRELEHARLAAETAAHAKGEFLANMSHEIRTPLNAVIGMTSLLVDSTLDETQHDYVRTIRSSGEHLLTLINAILDFSKIDAGKLELEDLPFDLRAVVEECVDLVALPATQKGVELTFCIDPRPDRSLVGDPGRLRQILVNLLGNAIKFTPRGEVSLRVEARELADRRYEVLFSVRDSGVGIPPDRIDRLFREFSQVDASTTRHYGGTGLGLAISKKLVELMHGRIWVESELGKGATFHFTIRARAAPPVLRAPRHEELAALRGRRVLVVDDNATNRLLARAYTESWQMTPTETGDPAEALHWVERSDPFDLALLDFQMPDIDGLTLAQRIRSHRDARSLPIVILSSIGDALGMARARGVEIEGYVVKPVRPAQLFDTVLNALRGGTVRERATGGAHEHDRQMAERLPLRLLVVEDNAMNQKVALGMLARLGYRADVAGDGREAVDAVARQPYDVVFMDVQMPIMDGYSASREIRRRFAMPVRPVIVAMTANALAGDRERCLEAGMDAYISKPVRATELAEALVRAAEQRATRVAARDAQPDRAGPAKAPPSAARTPAGAESPSPAPREAGPAMEAVVAFEELDEMRETLDAATLADIVREYLDGTPSLLGELADAWGVRDPARAVRPAHDLKSTSRAVGARVLADLAESVEHDARRGTLEFDDARLERIRIAAAATVTSVDDWLRGAGTAPPRG